MRRTAVVLGATSYVGGFVVDELLSAGFTVVAVARNPELAQVILDRADDRVWIVPGELATRQLGEGSRPDAIINLAYVKRAPPHRAVAENRRLADLVHDLAIATASPRVIHASTIAVFGVPLERAPEPAPVARRRDDLYIDLKCRAEDQLRRRASGAPYRLSIVRLGNVVGPGSPAWTARLGQRLLEGRPLGWAGRSGPSNATDVHNAAHYLRRLAEHAPDALAAFGTFHHLTEFAHHSWDEWIEPAERATGLRRVAAVAGAVPPTGTPLSRGVRRLRRAYGGRAGSYARAALARLSAWQGFDRLLARAKASEDLSASLHGPVTPSDDAALCDFFAGARAAPPHILPGTTLPVSFAEAVTRINRWLVEAGFAVRRDG